jgi:hypothetical protein
MIYAVISMILAEKRFIINGMIYEEINMIYTVPSMIYRHQYDSCSHQYDLGRKRIYSQRYDLGRNQYDLQFLVWFLDTSMIHAVTSMVWAEKTFIVNCMIYEEINMIYSF